MTRANRRRMASVRSGAVIMVAMAIGLGASACGTDERGGAPAPTNLDELVEAAEAEGEVSVYSAVAPAVLDSVASAFEEKYDISVNAVRLSSTNLYTRFSSEAQTGRPGADVIMPTFGEENVSTLVENDFVTPLEDAGIPGYPEDFPDYSERPDFGAAGVNYVQNGLAYNTDLVDDSEVPTSWAELADPKWKGKLVAAGPESSPSAMNFYAYLLQTQGADFLTALRENGIKFDGGGTSPAVQNVAAGEGELAFPAPSTFVLPVAEEGAPVAYQEIQETSGLQIAAFLAAKAEHPSAANLFLHFVLNEEGADSFTGDPGITSPFDAETLEGLTPEQPATEEDTQRVLELLGQ